MANVFADVVISVNNYGVLVVLCICACCFDFWCNLFAVKP